MEGRSRSAGCRKCMRRLPRRTAWRCARCAMQRQVFLTSTACRHGALQAVGNAIDVGRHCKHPFATPGHPAAIMLSALMSGKRFRWSASGSIAADCSPRLGVMAIVADCTASAWGDGNCTPQLGVMVQVSSYETEYFGLMANGTGIKYQYSGCAPYHL